MIRSFSKKSKVVTIVFFVMLIVLAFSLLLPIQTRAGGYLKCLNGQNCTDNGLCSNPAYGDHTPTNPVKVDKTLKFHILKGQLGAFRAYARHITKEYNDGCYDDEVRASLFL